jgi:hypothetical protein
MGKMTRKQARRAVESVEAWRLLGAPLIVTAYEAHRLTGGAVGVPMGKRGDSRPLRLAAVAVAYSKQIG